MCLKIEKDKGPAKGNIRWKFLKTEYGSNILHSPSGLCDDFYWEKKNTSNLDKNDPQSGFHVFNKKIDAINCAKAWANDAENCYFFRFFIVKLKVSNFKAAGTVTNCLGADRKESEIWENAEILEIWTLGKRKVTNKFFPKKKKA